MWDVLVTRKSKTGLEFGSWAEIDENQDLTASRKQFHNPIKAM